jgi:hypothetical protein
MQAPVAGYVILGFALNLLPGSNLKANLIRATLAGITISGYNIVFLSGEESWALFY